MFCFFVIESVPLHCTTLLQGILKSLSYKVELMGVLTYFCGMERRYESDNSFLELQLICQIKFLDLLFAGSAPWKKHLVSSAQSIVWQCGLCADKENESNTNVKSNSNNYNNYSKYITCKKWDILFHTINIRTLFISLQTNFGQKIGHFAETKLKQICALKHELHWNNICEKYNFTAPSRFCRCPEIIKHLNFITRVLSINGHQEYWSY